MKKYFVEFEYTNKVCGYVDAKNRKDAERKIRCAQPCDFDELYNYTQSSDMDFEIECIMEQDPE